MTPNPTSAPAPQEQRRLAEEFVQEVVDCTDNNGELDPYRKEGLTNELVALLNVERTDERSRLAEEAERQFNQTHDLKYMAVAAWLREKTQ